MIENNKNYDQFRSFWRRISTKNIEISQKGISVAEEMITNDQQ